MDTVVASLESASISRSQKHDDLDQRVTAVPEPHTIEPHHAIAQSGLSGAPSPENRNLCCECAKINLETIFHVDPGTIGAKGIEVANLEDGSSWRQLLSYLTTCVNSFGPVDCQQLSHLVAIPSGRSRCSLVTPNCQVGKYPEASEQKISSFLRLCLRILEKWKPVVSEYTIVLWPISVLRKTRWLWNFAGNMATFSAPFPVRIWRTPVLRKDYESAY
jgi:hypothetical protein